MLTKLKTSRTLKNSIRKYKETYLFFDVRKINLLTILYLLTIMTEILKYIRLILDDFIILK